MRSTVWVWSSGEGSSKRTGGDAQGYKHSDADFRDRGWRDADIRVRDQGGTQGAFAFALRGICRLARSFAALTSSRVAQKEEAVNYLHEFVLHASLDNVDEAIWTTQSCYLKAVDRYYDLTVSAYTTSSLVKFLLLHDMKNDEGIRGFFQEIHEYYIKVCHRNAPCTLRTNAHSPRATTSNPHTPAADHAQPVPHVNNEDRVHGIRCQSEGARSAIFALRPNVLPGNHQS